MDKSCFYCGKKKRSGSTFYKLDSDGHEICLSCISKGYFKSSIAIIEHNKRVDIIIAERRKSNGHEKRT